MPPVDGPKTQALLEFSAHQHRGAGPSLVANAGRNAGAEPGRRRRWGRARDALWRFVDPHLDPGMRVAVLGAGNADDLPLRRIAARA
ncbi:MAG TPA: hypothetical protein VJL81_05370, partial [Solirubrobacterales bacterium]|nr:hypothetical protein [Solirubrobacterales bacterium]